MRKDNRMLVNILLLSAILIGAVGAFLKYGLLRPLGIHREERIMEIPFVILADDVLSYEVSTAYEGLQLQQEETLNETMSDTEPINQLTTAPSVVPLLTEATEPLITERETVAPTEPTETVPCSNPSEMEEIETTPVYQKVDEDWFDDVLFIGDSRTVGLRDYARLGDADYFCKVSMSLFNVLEWETSDEDFKSATLDEVLQSHTYGKIYIHLGLNEVGQNKEEILIQYRKLLDLIQIHQPEARIILQAMMSVTKEKAKTEYFSLENIQTVNSMIRSLAEEEGFIFEDVNCWIADEDGYMYKEMTFDGCHLYGKGYLEWSQWIWDSAGWYGIP